jgi:hypothetical protein
MKRREDLFTMLLRNFCFIEKDRIWIEIPIKSESKLPLEFIITSRRQVKGCFKAMPHLEEQLTEVKSHSELN